MTPPSAPFARLPTPLRRAPLLVLGVVALLAGLLGGLARIGWVGLPVLPGSVPFHGPLMVAGFLGTVIGLERAVASGAGWAYAGPLLTGAGTLVAALTPFEPARGSVALGGAVTCAVLLRALRRQPTRWTATQAAAAAAFVVGSALWAAGVPLPAAVPWWQAFLVLTIVGERLELSRLLQPTPRALGAFSGLVLLVFAGALAASLDAGLGVRVGGVAQVGLALWLGRWDLARRSVRSAGLTRYMAVAILAGLFWLGASGVLALAFGGVQAGPAYDAMLHALLLGFVFSLIFGHAPVIFPAVLGLTLRFRPRFWAHLALLHAGVLLRVAADLAGAERARRWGALLNALAIVLFLAQTASALRPAPARRS